MPTLRDLSRRGALDALAALARKEPMNATEFMRAAGIAPQRAAILREELHILGFLESKVVKEAVRGDGSVWREFEVTLTPLGREVGRRFAEVEEILRAADLLLRKDRDTGPPTD